MLIDGDGRFAIIDHKSFPGVIKLDIERLRSFGGQMSLYSRALVSATGRDGRDYLVNQPIIGTMTRVDLG